MGLSDDIIDVFDGKHARFTRPDTIQIGGTDTLDAVQRAHIEAVLQRCGWRINGPSNAAERLGIHPHTRRFRMKKLSVVGPAARGRLQDPAARRPST